MDMDRYIGRLLDGRYEILEVIGIGGMAVVYKARCHRLNRLVAIKILKDDYSQDSEFKDRFHAESQAVAMLSHPNIVSVYDVSTSGDADYIVMELIEGITLKQYMEKKGVLNWKETLHFSNQIAKALEHAHSRGIVHRDIKPHNIMVLKNGSVKVADFGIARLMSKGNTLTKEALGSVHYISPEQAKGGRVDSRSDLYSLGVVMYEMMAGRPPYDGESPVAVAIQHINGGAPVPSSLNPNIPGGLEQIIMKAMALDPNDRYSSATEILNDMEEFRKNPAILFDYNQGGDIEPPQLHVVPPVRPTEQQPVQHRRPPDVPRTEADHTARIRNTGPQYREQQSPARRNQNAERKRQQEEKEEQRSRIATIAIVSCSAVAVLAIIIFLITLLGGSMTNQKQEYVLVPNLVGEFYEEVATQENLEVVLQTRTYDAQFEKGRIIDQKPEANGQEVAVGTKIHVIVSSGPEPQVKMMEDLTALAENEARAFLNNQKIDLQVLVKREVREDYEPGIVFKTEPSEGAQLEKGQTVTLWVSEKPEVKTAKMPKVVGQNLSTALGVLKTNGFENVDYEPVESYKPKDQVVSQSIPSNTKLDVNTLIVLEYSEGPKETTAPPTKAPETTVETTVAPTTVPPTTVPPTTTPPTTVPPTTVPPTTVPPTTTPPATEPEIRVTIPVTLNLPQNMEEPYLLGLRQNNQKIPNLDDILIEDLTLKTMRVELTGSGVQTFELLVNNKHYSDVKVDFTPYG